MRATSIQQNVKTAGMLGGFSIFATLHQVLTYNNITFIYRVGVQSTNGINLYADFDMNKGLATLYDAEGNVLRQDSISENAKAMFTTIDPHAESYYHLSPYSYCGRNPINRIDPTGKDWYQNNQTSYYTWYDGNGEREGFTHIGGQRNEKGEI